MTEINHLSLYAEEMRAVVIAFRASREGSSALMNMQHLLPIAASWLSRRKFLLHDYFTEMGF